VSRRGRPRPRRFSRARSASVECGLSSLGLSAKAAGRRTSALYPVMKANGIFRLSSRSAIAKLFSRIRPTSSSAKSGARAAIMSSAVATLAAVRTALTPKPRMVSSKSRAMIGSSSTISTSSGMRSKALCSMISLTTRPSIKSEPIRTGLPLKKKIASPVPNMKPSHRGFVCLCTCAHNDPAWAVIVETASPRNP
jgi:hypothetical protein